MNRTNRILLCLSDSMHRKAHTVMETSRCRVFREGWLTSDWDEAYVVGGSTSRTSSSLGKLRLFLLKPWTDWMRLTDISAFVKSLLFLRGGAEWSDGSEGESLKIPHKNLGIAAHACYPGAVEGGWGPRDRVSRKWGEADTGRLKCVCGHTHLSMYIYVHMLHTQIPHTHTPL